MNQKRKTSTGIVLVLSILFSFTQEIKAVTINTPTVSVGELIRSLDWNTMKGDLENLASASWNNTGTNLHHMGGNVGIGTTNPSAKLLVKTNTDWDGMFLQNENNVIIGKIARFNDSSGYLNLYESSGISKLQLRATGDSYLNGGNVGIGTTEPSAKLEIEGYSSSLPSVKRLLALNEKRASDYTGGWRSGIDYKFNGTSKAEFGIFGHTTNGVSDSTGAFYITADPDHNNILADNLSLITLEETGNVGIGTTSPNAKLHVDGTIYSKKIILDDIIDLNAGAHVTIMKPNNTKQALISFVDKLTDNQVGVLGMIAGNDDLSLMAQNNRKLNLMAEQGIILNPGTNVGIGTTNPTEKLEVDGNVKITGNFKFPAKISSEFLMTNTSFHGGTMLHAGTGTGGNSMLRFSYNENASGINKGLFFGSSDTTSTLMDSIMSIRGGQVGIGTTEPTEKLEVDGNVKITGTNQLKLGNIRFQGYTGFYPKLYSDHSTTTGTIYYDKEGTLYGYIYGSGNGRYFGLLDGDGNWSYLADKDVSTNFLINNTSEMTIYPTYINMRNNRVTSVGTPTAATDAATKEYVDNQISGAGAATGSIIAGCEISGACWGGALTGMRCPIGSDSISRAMSLTTFICIKN